MWYSLCGYRGHDYILKLMRYQFYKKIFLLLFCIWKEPLELDNIKFHWNDVQLENVDNIDELLHILTNDNFLAEDNEFEDGTLEEYDDEGIMIMDSDSNTSDENDDTSSDEEIYIVIILVELNECLPLIFFS